MSAGPSSDRGATDDRTTAERGKGAQAERGRAIKTAGGRAFSEPCANPHRTHTVYTLPTGRPASVGASPSLRSGGGLAPPQWGCRPP